METIQYRRNLKMSLKTGLMDDFEDDCILKLTAV